MAELVREEPPRGTRTAGTGATSPGTLRRTRAVSKSAIERAISLREVPLREKTLWRMLYETAARANEILSLNMEDLDLDTRRAPIRETGGNTAWIHWGSGTAHLLPRLLRGRDTGPVFLSERRPGPARPASCRGPVPGHRSGTPRLRPCPRAVHPSHRLGAAPTTPLRRHPPRRSRRTAATHHGQNPAPQPTHHYALHQTRRRDRRRSHRTAGTTTPTRVTCVVPTRRLLRTS